MSRRALILSLTAPLLAAALAAIGPAPARALAFSPCAAQPGFGCTTVSVPLDRSGALPGSLLLSVERKAAGATPTGSAVLALAGGPGQAVLPLAEFIARAVAPALDTRDLLLFDQRGTGASGPLGCTALSGPPNAPVDRVVERCALEIGPARGDYTTPESVADIDAVRRAAGYEKLVLYATSYGTKVALEYAERYPEHVEALVLDSVVAPGGPEPLEIPSFQAIGGILSELCSGGACAEITSDPLGDLARLAARLRRRALSGSAFDGSGHRSSVTLNEDGLLEVLQAGDLNPALRALLPAAVRSALRGDPDPLLRLHLLAEGLIPTIPREPVETSPPVDEALFLTTSCEETPFPWQRSSPPATRRSEAIAALHGAPQADFYPFDASTALSNGLLADCDYWPDASGAPPSPGALPDVPSLILSGGQDLRTPTSVARQIAVQIPDAQLLVVPYTGHSVIGSDFSGCAEAAVSAFFADGAVEPCTSSRNLFAPTPIAPTRLSYVRPPAGFGGKPGRTLTAALDALVDLDRQVIGATLQFDRELPSGTSFGGLRGGFARLTASAAILHNFSFVPGVALSGRFPVRDGVLEPATIRVSGADASPGRVTFGLGRRVTGTLGGRRFDVSLAAVKLSRVDGAGEWPSAPLRFPLPGLVVGR